MYYVFEGVGEDGFTAEGTKHVEGIQVLDEKTVQFTTKEPMSLLTFENSYARYLMTLPKYKIEQYSESELMTAEWFSKPDVVNGPFFLLRHMILTITFLMKQIEITGKVRRRLIS